MSDNKQVGETPSSEVANRFRSCRDLSDIIPLYPSHALYLKPLAKVNVSVSLPQLKTPGKTISTWEVMEKIRALILPDEFSSLKVAKSTLEFIRLEGDLRDRCRLPRVLARLDLQQLNLSGFSNVLKVRAAEAKDDFPTRHSWNSYFRDAKHMNELKAGERPDTIHITGLPVKWFTEDNANLPSESLITKIFKKWGALRKVDVPAADPYRSRMRLGNNIHKFSFEDGIFFDVYVQYVEYMDFVRAMDALRGMKLLKKDGQNSLTATLKVDFDKTKHLSDSSISHRDFERKRLIAQDNLAAEKMRKREEAEKKRQEEQRKKEEADSVAKANRRRNREERRKRKALTKFRKQEEDKVSMKIAREEQKLIKAQRQLESIRLLDELFDRIKTKVEKKEIKLDQNTEKKSEKKNNQTNEKKVDSENDKKNKEKQIKKKTMKKEKKKKKKQKKTQKKRKKGDNSGSDSTTEEESDKETSKKKLKSVLIKNDGATSSTGAVAGNLPYDYSGSMSMSVLPSMAPFHAMRMPRYARGQMMRSPGYSAMSLHHPMLPMGRGRGFVPRYEMNYSLTNPYLYNGQYYEYFTHLVERDSKQQKSRIHNRQKSTSRSISRTRTRSVSKRRSRSISRSRSRRRSDSRSKSRDRRSQSRSRSRSRRSRSRSRRSRSQSRKSKSRSRRSKSRSRNRSRSRSRRKSPSRSCSKRKTKSRSNSKTRHKSNKLCSRSKSSSKTRHSRSRRNSRSRSRSKSRSRNRYRSKRGKRSSSIVKVTRAKSRPTSPRRRSRSSSWSLPKSPGRRSCSWSRAASANNINEQDVSKESEKLIQEETTKTAKMQSAEALEN
ncbi:A-kinase anchor protein 17A [Trachymyrmex zeteki]|uniref:A-kinase anchor protein 17A n=1 Tax=Mycetomoellerius zeteki TaxID=64791 RepID=A0A151WK29_9HYME|nr:PREDICTED: A-kinase anchor protein 17A [Trachymyrmex zeteki]KYQ48181.1 A-kinase anchor protein 17A [Trachymyrmex zeteki]